MDRATVDALLAAMVECEKEVSDLLFIVGKPPLVESHGQLREFPIDTPGSVLSDTQISNIADHIIAGNDRLEALYAATGSCDTSYVVKGVARLRVNVFKQNAGKAIVMRKFPSHVPTLEQLALPPVFRQMVQEKNGIILVTGAAGSGKSTTLAAIINHLNQTQPIHLLTLEDPIEFLHPGGLAVISQRELGRDFNSFADGLRVALRQAPKGILLGEIRDRETMEIAMTASETGHVVFSSLHTINAGQTINRILGFFPREDEEHIRYRLADTLRYIASQRLVAKVGGGRVLITEVIGSSLRTREAIRYGESENKTFNEIIEAAGNLGWHTFDQSLIKAREADLITDETAIMHCNSRPTMQRELDLRAKLSADHRLDTGSGLKLDRPTPVLVTPENLSQAEENPPSIPANRSV